MHTLLCGRVKRRVHLTGKAFIPDIITAEFTDISTCDILGSIGKSYQNRVCMTQQKPLAEQLAGEPTPDYIKFLVFVGMGSNRSLDKAYRQFYETTNGVSQAWRTLADKYRWAERASDYDKRSA